MNVVRRFATATVLSASLVVVAGCSSPAPAPPRSTGAGSDAASSAAASTGSAAASAAAGAASASVLEPLSAAIPAGLQRYYSQKLTWTTSGCDAGFQCATMKVPLDYVNPGSGSADISLAVVRRKGSGQGSQHLGSLLVNPGGPGGSAIDYAEYAATSYPAVIRNAYDIVGMDPRGVNRSTPVNCLTNQQMDAFAATDTTPDSQAEISTLLAADKTFAQGCEQRSGALLGHVSTVEAAKDMDVLRALLGDAKLNYLGKSYGTFLGATYAGLFPSRVGHLVLDGAMNPSLDALQLDSQQAGGFETAFNAFAADCVKQSNCPLGSTTQQAGTRLDALFLSWDKHPLPTDSPSRPLGEALGTTGVISAMYDQGQWPILRAALTQAVAGNGSGLLALSDQYYERSASGQYQNLMAANAAVNCLDLAPAATTPQEVEQQLATYRKSSPHFGTTLAWSGLSCAAWPVKPTGEPHTIPAKGAAPILVVGTTRDPATPYAWAQALAAQLDSGTLLSFNGDGHTAYERGSVCVDSDVNAYLLTGATPAKGTMCD
jgi:pimeloyl-ACP methyl ester carboxylesterase